MENIQVAVRIRPLLPKEKSSGNEIALESEGNSIKIKESYLKVSQKKLRKNFIYDDIFSPQETNDVIYARRVRRVALKCLEGYNGTVFMYGQTGSGKTYTMLGYTNETGLYNQMASPREGKLKINQNSSFLSKDDYVNLMYDRNMNSLLSNNGILLKSLREIFEKIDSVSFLFFGGF